MSFSWWSQFARRCAAPRTRAERRHAQRQATLHLETLEGRDVPSVATSTFLPDYVVLPNSGKVTLTGEGGITGFIPSQILQAYGTNQISFNGVPGNGAGTTIALVDAYSDPTITTDVQAFDKQFNLPNPVLKIVNQTGGSTLPTANAGWAGEITLDVEWAHAIAPEAHILLVEATGGTLAQQQANLLTAAKYAGTVPGVDVVSMSFGFPEYAGETAADSSVFSPGTNVVFVASAGDSGTPDAYPSASPDVLSVGGTNLKLTSSGGYLTEKAWGGTYGDGSGGGGLSLYESEPAFQLGVVPASLDPNSMRANPDVSYDSDPQTGFAVYETYGNNPKTPWIVVGGTSDAAPQWAALLAITDQGRILAGETPLSNSTLMPMLYQLPPSDFNDVVHGATVSIADGFPGSGSGPTESAVPGYDLATGLGSPVANLLVPSLVAGTNVTQFSISAPTTSIAGNSFSVTVSALNAANQTIPGYAGTVDFSSSDGAAILPNSYTFTSADAGTHTFTFTLGTNGNQTITATDDNDSSIAGTASVLVGSGDTFSVTGLPSSDTAGNSDNFTVTALAPDGTTVLTSYSGTVQLTSSDPNAVFPSTVNLTNGVGTFSVAFETAGTQSLTATDTIDPTFTGTESIAINPAAPSQLAFVQQPSNSSLGSFIGPAVTVAEEDQYGNVIATDSSSKVTLTLGANPGDGVLSGGSAKLSKGIATFGNLSVSVADTGYTLVAGSGSLTPAISGSFNELPNPLLANFSNGLGLWMHSGIAKSSLTTSTAAAHPGTSTYGLSDGGDGNWYYRTDPAGVVNPGDSLSVWVKFAVAANGRAYFGFGSTPNGTLSVVLAPNTGQLLIQNNAGYDTYTQLAAVNQTYSANSWYQLVVDWGTTGVVTANLFASNGTTLLNSVTAATNDTTTGDFAFRATGSTKYFATVYDTRGIAGSSDYLAPTGSTQNAGVVSGTSVAFLAPSVTPTADVASIQSKHLRSESTLDTPGSGALVPPLRHTLSSDSGLGLETLWYPGGEQVHLTPDGGLLLE